MGNKTGTRTSTIIESPARKKRRARARKREEQRWAKKSGMVKYTTLAEGFAARAADEQKKIDMQNEIAKTMRGEQRD